MDAARKSSQHKQARERERLKGIKEDEEMEDESLPKQVPYILQLGCSCPASLFQTHVQCIDAVCQVNYSSPTADVCTTYTRRTL